MRERPIALYDFEVLNALTNGTGELRRVIRPQPSDEWPQWWHGRSYGSEAHFKRGVLLDHCPYGQAGDRLWVRETFCSLDDPLDGFLNSTEDGKWSRRVVYKQEMDAGRAELPDEFKWRPSIFMPRWASRITLEVEEVRAERLQDITEEGAIAEGTTVKAVAAPGGFFPTAFLSGTFRYGYAQTWDFRNAKRGYPWSSNPWDWAIRFKKVEAI